MTETLFNKVFYLLLMPGAFLLGHLMEECFISLLAGFILIYHLYSNHKYKTWPWNTAENPASICEQKKNPYWTEFFAFAGALFLIGIGIKKLKTSLICSLLTMMSGVIFGIAHLRQIFICDNNYYKWLI